MGFKISFAPIIYKPFFLPGLKNKSFAAYHPLATIINVAYPIFTEVMVSEPPTALSLKKTISSLGCCNARL